MKIITHKEQQPIKSIVASPSSISLAQKPTKLPSLMPGNGLHKAVGLVQGKIIFPKNEADSDSQAPPKFTTQLEVFNPDGSTNIFPCILANKLQRFQVKQPNLFTEPATYVVYPRTGKRGKISRLIIIALDDRAEFTQEEWTVVGVWDNKKKQVLVQRSADVIERKRIHHYEISLDMTPIFAQKQFIAQGNCYNFVCLRNRDTLIAQQATLVKAGEKPKKNKYTAKSGSVKDVKSNSPIKNNRKIKFIRR